MFGLNEALMSFIRRQVGLRTDAANVSGSLHSRAGDIKADLTIIKSKNVIAYNSVIKSIQRGFIQIYGAQTSQSVTISSVIPGKTMLNLLGVSGPSMFSYPDPNQSPVVAAGGYLFARLTLTDSTTVTVSRAENQNVEIVVSYEVIEFY